MRIGDLDRLAKDIEMAVEDAPLHVQATVQQYIDCSPTIDPIRAAGGCRCGECQHHGAVDGPMRQCDITDDNDFCSYGEPREAQDNG